MGLTGGHRPVFVGTVWPSTALVLPSDAAPAMAGGADAAETERDIVASALPEGARAEFERLAKAPELDRAAAMTLASLLVPAFDNAGAEFRNRGKAGGRRLGDVRIDSRRGGRFQIVDRSSNGQASNFGPDWQPVPLPT